MSEKNGVRVRTDIATRFGRSIIVGSYKVEFDSTGIAELSIEEAENVVSAEVGIFYENQKQAVQMAKMNADENSDVLSKQLDRFIKENDSLKEENSLLKEKNESLKVEIIKLTQDIEKSVIESELVKPDQEDSDEDNPFKDKTLDECRALCEEAKFPKNEWGRLGEVKLKKYLLSKLQEEESETEK